MIYLFDREEKLIKIIRSDAIQSAIQSQELTKDGYVSDKLIVNTKLLNDIDLEQVEYIAIRSVNDKFKYDMYFLLSHSTEHRITELIGVQSGIEELRKSPVYDIRPTGDARLHATQLVKDTNWTIGYVPETPRLFKNYYYQDAFESLKEMCQLFGIEMQFHVEINNNRIGNRYIEFKKRIGTATHRRVVYGHNALKIVKEVQRANLVTALVGRGKGEEVSSAEDNASGQVGYGRKITFEDVEWTKANGKPVDKPLGQKYVEVTEATLKYGIKTPEGMRPKIGFVSFENIEDRNLLLERTYETLIEMCRPQVLFQTSSAYLTAEIGDTIRVIRHDIQIDYAVRVIKIEWDRLTNRATKIELGDRLTESSASQMRSITSQAISRATEDINRQVIGLIDNLPSADGFNRNFYSETEPKDPRINDIWYAPDPEHEGRLQILMWNGKIWERLDVTPEGIEEKFNEINAQAEQLNQNIAESEQRIQTELAKVGTLSDNAKKAADNALVEFANANAEMSQAVEDAKTALSSAESNIAETARLLAEQGIINGELTTYKNEVAETMKGFVKESTYNSKTKEILDKIVSWEVTSDGIRSSIERTEAKIPTSFENRNLLINSNLNKSRHTYTKDTTKELVGNGTYYLDYIVDFKPNTEYTLSVGDFELNGKEGLRVVIYDSEVSQWKWNIYREYEFKPNSSVTFTTPSTVVSGDKLLIYPTDGTKINYVIKELKLEEGKIKTPYSSAPEDMIDNLNTFKNEYNRTSMEVSDKLTQLVNRADGLDLKTNNLVSTAESTTREITALKERGESIDSKIAEYKQSIDGYSAKLKSYTETNNQLTTKVNNFESTIEGYSRQLGEVQGSLDKKNILKDSWFEPYINSNEYMMVDIPFNIVPIEGNKYTIRIAAALGTDINRIGLWNSGTGVHLTYVPKNNQIKNIKTHNNKEASVYEITLTWSNSYRHHSVSQPTSLRLYADSPNNGWYNLYWVSMVEGEVGKDWEVNPSEIVKFNKVTEKVDFFEHLIGTSSSDTTAKQNLARMVMTDSLFQKEVSKNGDIKTIQTQLSNSWAVQNLNSNEEILAQINQTNGVTKIQNKLIQLDGTVAMDEAFANNLLAKNIDVNILKALTARINALQALTIDVNKITGDKMSFISGIFTSNGGDLRLDGDRIKINQKVFEGVIGSYSKRDWNSILDSNGLSFGIGDIRHGRYTLNSDGGLFIELAENKDLLIGGTDTIGRWMRPREIVRIIDSKAYGKGYVDINGLIGGNIGAHNRNGGIALFTRDSNVEARYKANAGNVTFNEGSLTLGENFTTLSSGSNTLIKSKGETVIEGTEIYFNYKGKRYSLDTILRHVGYQI